MKKLKWPRPRRLLFLSSFHRLFAENRLLKLCALVMALATAGQCLLSWQRDQQQRTLVLPLGCGGLEYQIYSDRADDVYLKQMIRLVLDLKGNIQPATARIRFNELLRLVHPSAYGRLQTRWREEADTLKQYPAISYQVLIDEDTHPRVTDHSRIEVRAQRQRRVGPTVAGTDTVRYRLHYRIEHGRFWLLDLEELLDGRD